MSFGVRLGDFVRAFPFADAYGVSPDALADLARLEQAQLEVQEAEDDGPSLSADALASLTPEEWEQARFDLSRALRVVFTDHDVLPAVRAVARGESPQRPQAGRIAYLVSRQGGAAVTEALDPQGAAALAALAEGASFAEACAKAGGDGAIEAAIGALGTACARSLVRAIRV